MSLGAGVRSIPMKLAPDQAFAGRRLGRNGLGAAAGLLVDRALGEPRQFHPVAGFGRAMGVVERSVWRDRRAAGMAYAAVGVALGAGAGRAARSVTAAVAVATAGRELRRVAADIGDRLEADDLEGARALLPSLVGRDPSELDESAVAAAVIESLAENTVDAVVAPAFWALVAGAPGAAGYRAVNTMDAMVGHRSERYARFGWGAARLDDLANLVPARLFAGLVVAARPGAARSVLTAVRRDASAHPSPNAGVAEAAVAGALGRQLGGTLRYGSRTEHRPTLGAGPRPEPADIRAAIALVDRTERILVAALCLPALPAAGRRLRSVRSRRRPPLRTGTRP